jgi:outer membrane protein assembly factor BamB
VEGFVERGREGNWIPLEIGDSVEANDSIRTGPDGSCDIQFGGSATMRIQPATLYLVNTVALSAEANRIEGSLSIGTVLSKVNKLTGNDAYMIRTESSVAGVRGTDFVVSNDSVNGTTVAVKSGSVAVLPVSPAVYKLLEASSANPAAAAAVRSIVASASIVGANQELTIDKATADLAALVYEDIAQEVALISSDSIEALSAAATSGARDAAASGARDAAASGARDAAAAAVPGGSGAAFASAPVGEGIFATSPLIAAGDSIFPSLAPALSAVQEKAAAGGAQAQPPEPALQRALEALERINEKAETGLQAQPARSLPERSPFIETFKRIDTMPVATAALQGAAEPVSLLRTGQEPADGSAAEQTGVAAIAPAASATAPASSAAQAASAAAPTAGGPAASVPAPAVPQAKAVPAPKPAPSPAIAAAKPAPAAKRDFLVAEWEALKGSVSGRVVRVPSSDVFVLSDPRGTISGVSAAGKLLWTVATENRGAELMSAVPFKGVVYYSGSNEYLAIDALKGTVLQRVALDGDRSHVLGNRVVPFPDALVFPTMSGLEVLDPQTGAVMKTLPVPGGSTMSPANYEGMAAIVNQKGMFMLIDLASGDIKAQVQTGALQPVALAPQIFGQRACFADRKGLLVMIDLATMTVAWERPLPIAGGVFTDVEMGGEGVFAYGRQTVFAYSLEGAELMKPIGQVSAPPLLSQGVLYYGTNDGFLVALGLSPIAERGRVRLGSRLSARPLLADGFLYAGTNSGRLLKLDPAKIGE